MPLYLEGAELEDAVGDGEVLRRHVALPERARALLAQHRRGGVQRPLELGLRPRLHLQVS